MKKALLIIALFFVLVLNNACANKCLQNRTSFDIGPGTTKMVVATVDTCMQNVKQLLEEKSIAVEYQADLDRSGGIFSEEIQKKAWKP